MNTFKHNVCIVESERSVLECLVKQIKTSNSTQVLVTGPASGNQFWKDQKEIDNLLSTSVLSGATDRRCSFCGNILNNGTEICQKCRRKLSDTANTSFRWNFFGPPYSPSRLAIKKSLDSFANTIKFEPRTPHIYIGPTYEKDVVKCLFFPSSSYRYKCGVYVLGIFEDPLTQLNTISKAVSGLPHMIGNITSIFSISDKSVTNEFKRRLVIARERKEDIRELTLLYFKFIENMKWLQPGKRKSADRKLIRNVKKTLKKDVIPKLYPKKLFPQMKLSPWWKFW